MDRYSSFYSSVFDFLLVVAVMVLVDSVLASRSTDFLVLYSIVVFFFSVVFSIGDSSVISVFVIS